MIFLRRLILGLAACFTTACGRGLPPPAVVAEPPPGIYNWIPTVLPAHAATPTSTPLTVTQVTATAVSPTPTLEPIVVAAAADQGLSVMPPAPELAGMAQAVFGSNQPTRLIIPAIGVDTEVVPVGWHTETVDGQPSVMWDSPGFSAGFLVTSAAPGQSSNVAFYGHNNILGSVFRYLDLLRPGYEVQVINAVATWRYAVETVDIFQEAGAGDDERLARLAYFAPTPDERVTLLSCWPFTNNSHRVVVVAKPAP